MQTQALGVLQQSDMSLTGIRQLLLQTLLQILPDGLKPITLLAWLA